MALNRHFSNPAALQRSSSLPPSAQQAVTTGGTCQCYGSRYDGSASGQTAAEDIARVIHAANRELQIVQGDPRPSPPWDEAPEYQVRESVASVAEALTDPDRTPEQNHQGWYERMIADGWRYGPVKDEAAKTHPDLDR